MVEEQETEMTTLLSDIRGIGPVTAQIFETSGFITVTDLSQFNCDDKKLIDAIKRVKGYSEPLTDIQKSVLRRLRTRCINIVSQIQNSIENIEIIEPPEEFLCPITHAFMRDPVTTPNGHSYERSAILRWLRENGTDPMTRRELSPSQLRSNITLRNVCDFIISGTTRFTITIND